MSAISSVFTGIGALQHNYGTYSPVDVTKDTGIQSSLGSLINQYQGQQAQDSTDLGSYIKQYLAGNNQAAQNTGQESSAINRYYNGDVARQLADLRAQQSQLGNQSVAQALAYQRGNANRAMVAGGGGGDNSYNNRIGVGTAANLNLANNLALLGQNRADINQVNQGQLSLVGQRNSLADALAARTLTPDQVANQNLAAQAGVLSGLTGISNANNLYGARYNPSASDAGAMIGGGLGGVMGQVGSLVGGGGSSSQSGQPTQTSQSDTDFINAASNSGYGGAGGGDLASVLDYYNNVMGYQQPNQTPWGNISLNY